MTIERLKSDIDLQVVNAWIQEAKRRDREMVTGKVIGRPANDIFQRLRGYIK